eukprot:scaffold602_cov342-Prasinococcus_capsulatus_cf.AAC.25
MAGPRTAPANPVTVPSSWRAESPRPEGPQACAAPSQPYRGQWGRPPEPFPSPIVAHSRGRPRARRLRRWACRARRERSRARSSRRAPLLGEQRLSGLAIAPAREDGVRGFVEVQRPLGAGAPPEEGRSDAGDAVGGEGGDRGAEGAQHGAEARGRAARPLEGCMRHRRTQLLQGSARLGAALAEGGRREAETLRPQRLADRAQALLHPPQRLRVAVPEAHVQVVARRAVAHEEDRHRGGGVLPVARHQLLERCQSEVIVAVAPP